MSRFCGELEECEDKPPRSSWVWVESQLIIVVEHSLCVRRMREIYLAGGDTGPLPGGEGIQIGS